MKGWSGDLIKANPFLLTEALIYSHLGLSLKVIVYGPRSPLLSPNRNLLFSFFRLDEVVVDALPAIRTISGPLSPTPCPNVRDAKHVAAAKARRLLLV